jgi:hypothetical protein
MFADTKNYQIQQHEKKALDLHAQTLHRLKEEFNLKDDDLVSFVNSLLEVKIMEHLCESNSKVFSESETHEIEEDLKGLGYI